MRAKEISTADIMNLKFCEAKVSKIGKFDQNFDRCSFKVLYPGHTLCGRHYIDKAKALENGVYKVKNVNGELVQDEEAKIKLMWTDEYGWGVYIKEGQVGQLTTFYDGSFKSPVECAPYFWYV